MICYHSRGEFSLKGLSTDVKIIHVASSELKARLDHYEMLRSAWEEQGCSLMQNLCFGKEHCEDTCEDTCSDLSDKVDTMIVEVNEAPLLVELDEADS